MVKRLGSDQDVFSKYIYYIWLTGKKISKYGLEKLSVL